MRIDSALIRNSLAPLYLIIVIGTSLATHDEEQTGGRVGGGGGGGNKSCPASCLCGMGTSLHFKGYFSTVDCRNRKLSELPFSQLPRDTTVLLLRGNGISSFVPPPEFDTLNSLSDLDLSYNRIAMLDMSALNRTSMKVLILSSNSLRAVTKSCAFGKAKNLEILQLTNNRINELETGSFVGLKNLHRLSIAGNRLRNLQTDAFAGLSSLRELTIDRSQVVQIASGTFRSLSSLESLTLSFNELSQLPSGAFDELSNLQYVNLAGNRFETFPSDAMIVFQSLKSLNFDSNPIRKLTRQSLTSIGVQDISLSTMDALELVDREAFYDLRKLTVINMHDNPKLTYVDPSMIVNCFKLTSLYLHNNSLTTFSHSILNASVQLRDVNLSRNPLRCDCHTEWLTKQVRGNNNTIPHITVSDEINFCQDNRTENRLDNPKERGGTLRSYYTDSLKRNASALWTSIHLVNESRDATFDNDVMTEVYNTSVVVSSGAAYLDGLCPPVVFPFYNETIYHQLGTTLVMDCRSIGAPAPHTHWVFASRKVINTTSNYSRLKLDLRGTLTVEHVKQTDAGR